MKELMKFATEQQILDIMKNKQSAILVYRSDADGGEMLTRYVHIYVLGYTKAGNKAVRCWQDTGGSVSGQNAGWKILRLDRIVNIMPYGNMRENAPAGYDEDDDGLKNIIYSLPYHIEPEKSEEEIREQVKITQPTNTLIDWIKRWKEQRKNKKKKK